MSRLYLLLNEVKIVNKKVKIVSLTTPILTCHWQELRFRGVVDHSQEQVLETPNETKQLQQILTQVTELKDDTEGCLNNVATYKLAMKQMKTNCLYSFS